MGSIPNFHPPLLDTIFFLFYVLYSVFLFKCKKNVSNDSSDLNLNKVINLNVSCAGAPGAARGVSAVNSRRLLVAAAGTAPELTEPQAFPVFLIFLSIRTK